MIKYCDLLIQTEDLSQDYYHIFGGNEWTIVSGNQIDKPILLLTLNIRDPNLEFLELEGFAQNLIPICSYLNSDMWFNEQEFYIDYNNQEIVDKNVVKNIEPYPQDDRIPYVLPQRKLWSSSIKISDKYDMLDSLFGEIPFKISKDIVEIELENLLCKICGKPMKNIGYVGYEDFNSRNFIKNMAFFYGEGGLHISYCTRCSILRLNSIS